MESGETIYDGLTREVQEETTLTIDVDALTGIYQNMNRGVIALVFRCRPIEGTAQATAESSAVAWLSPNERTERMDEAYAVRLLDAMTGAPGGPAIRTHDGTHLLPVSP